MGNTNSIYVAKKAAVLTNPTAATTFLQSDNSAKAAAVYIPDQWQDNTVAGSFRFNIKAWGRMTGGTTTNFLPQIQFGVTTTAASNTDFTVMTTRAVNSTSGNWWINVDGIWDLTSLLINGSFTGGGGSAGTLNAPTICTQLTAKNLTTAGQGFTVSAIFSATNAGNLAYLDGLCLEVV
jgi:hypothetical protein